MFVRAVKPRPSRSQVRTRQSAERKLGAVCPAANRHMFRIQPGSYNSLFRPGQNFGNLRENLIHVPVLAPEFHRYRSLAMPFIQNFGRMFHDPQARLKHG